MKNGFNMLIHLNIYIGCPKQIIYLNIFHFKSGIYLLQFTAVEIYHKKKISVFSTHLKPCLMIRVDPPPHTHTHPDIL